MDLHFDWPTNSPGLHSFKTFSGPSIGFHYGRFTRLDSPGETALTKFHATCWGLQLLGMAVFISDSLDFAVFILYTSKKWCQFGAILKTWYVPYIHTNGIDATFIDIHIRIKFHSSLNIKSMWSFEFRHFRVHPTLEFHSKNILNQEVRIPLYRLNPFDLTKPWGFGVFVWNPNMRAPWFGRRSGNKHSTSVVATCWHDVGCRFFGLSKPVVHSGYMIYVYIYILYIMYNDSLFFEGNPINLQWIHCYSVLTGPKV